MHIAACCKNFSFSEKFLQHRNYTFATYYFNPATYSLKLTIHSSENVPGNIEV
jgi:hypothetical protein